MSNKKTVVPSTSTWVMILAPTLFPLPLEAIAMHILKQLLPIPVHPVQDLFPDCRERQFIPFLMRGIF